MVARLVFGFVVMSVGYLLALRAPGPTWIVVGFAAVFRMTLGLLPGLFSTDVFSYVMYGRIAAVYVSNPYVQPPSTFPEDAFLAWVFPFWRDQPSVYGPLWTDFSWFVSNVTARLSPLAQVLAYRATLIALEACTLGLLWWTLGRTLWRSPRDRTRAWILFAWNPLVLFDLVGSTHNDVAMLVLLALGLACVVRPWTPSTGWLLGLVAIALGALVKYATAVVVPVLAVAWSAAAPSRAGRLGRLLVGLGLPLALAAALWWPWLQPPSTALDVLAQAAGGRLVLNSAPDLVALTLADQALVPGGMPVEQAHEVARFWVRAVTRACFAAYLAYELARLWRVTAPRTAAKSSAAIDTQVVAVVRASARLLLVLPLLVFTWVWSWYFSWSLLVSCLLGARDNVARLCTAYTLVVLPVVYAHQYLNEQLQPSGGFVLAMALAPLLVVLPRQMPKREGLGR